MHRANPESPVFVAVCAAISVTVALTAACTGGQTDVVVFEGARVIVGDGSAPIEDAVFIVESGRFTAV